MPVTYFAAIFALLSLSFGGARAQAQAAGKSGPAGYAEAVDRALTELEAANYPEAYEEFQRAHAIYPNARTLRGLGMVEFELRNYTLSTEHLESALASKDKPLEGKLRAETAELLQRAQRYVGTLTVQLRPAHAELRVDGLLVERGLRTLRLDVGDHALEAQAPGHATERREVWVKGGTRTEVSLALAELSPRSESGAVQVAGTNTAGAARADAKPLYQKWWLWTTLAIVVAAGGATAAMLLLREQEAAAVSGPNTVGVTLHSLERF